MQHNLIAEASIMIHALPGKVWEGLTNPEMIEKYMMGATVTSDWNKGSAITWKGEYKGKKYTDKGKIIDMIRNKKLVYTHFSPLSGEEDVPENYHTISIVLDEDVKKTKVSLSQDKNSNENAKDESEKNWKVMLKGLKDAVEEEQ